jgi:hypothetical protein
MTKFSAFVIILALRIFYHPSNSDLTTIAPFTSPSPLPVATVSVVTPARIISVKGTINQNKVVLNWIVGDNETADQFEVEKSTDGKNFSMAALVFGTDEPATGNYEYFEKASKGKLLYRIKIISKNKSTEYSPVIVINS